ncbi:MULTISPECIES: hypothetical protein [Bacillus]|uniref:hypothetical protein n=1 Tax=Bacillus TaxID=1386 RepID=UPI000BB8F275|nr:MULTISPECIES: hypothetical protein [Bacillus]
MRYFSILIVSIILVTAGFGCSSDKEGKEEFKNLNQRINEEIGKEVFLPQFDDLDLSFAYVSYNNEGKARSVDVQYSKSVSEDIVEHMEYPNTEILYGPYNVDAVIMFSVDKSYGEISNFSGERIHINEIEVIISENIENDPFQVHMFIFNESRFVIGYKLDYFTQEEALEKTKEVVYSISN